METKTRRIILRGSGKRMICRCPRGPRGVVEAVDPQCSWRFRELLYDGPANCGKTFYDCYTIFYLLTKYPHVRILGLRETLKSMRESIQPIFESILGAGHPALMKGGGIMHRDEYTFPSDPLKPHVLDGGHFALGGLDHPDRYHSSEWDIIIPFEATNPLVREYDCAKIIGRGLRGKGIPHPHCAYPDGIITDTRMGVKFEGRRVRDVLLEYGDDVFPDGLDPNGHPLFFRQARFECNPSDTEGEAHWLWQKFTNGRIVRLAAKHTDNPTISKEDLQALSELPGTLKEGLYHGRWVATSGRVWASYDPKKHLVHGEFECSLTSGNRWVRVFDWTDERGAPKTFSIVSVIAGFDYGLTSPSALEVFAITNNRMAFRIGEIYRVQDAQTGEGTMGWYAERVVELVERWGLEAVLCDPSAGGVPELFNVYLQKHHKSSIAQPGNNTRKTKDGIRGGLDLVGSMFTMNRLFLFADCHIGPKDPGLLRARRPTGWDGEIVHYVKARDAKDPNKVLDYPDDRCIDHGCDSGRMALMDAFCNERVVKPKPAVVSLPDPWIYQSLADQEAERRRSDVAQLARAGGSLRALRAR